MTMFLSSNHSRLVLSLKRKMTGTVCPLCRAQAGKAERRSLYRNFIGKVRIYTRALL
jgi:hypothetical protein